MFSVCDRDKMTTHHRENKFVRAKKKNNKNKTKNKNESLYILYDENSFFMSIYKHLRIRNSPSDCS